MAVTMTTKVRMEKVFELIKGGCFTAPSIESVGFKLSNFYTVLHREPALREELRQAQAAGQVFLTKGIVADTSAHGKTWLLSRMHGKLYGKHKEDEMYVNLSQATKDIMKDPSSDGRQKIQALNDEFYNDKIELTLFERLLALVKASHPELNKGDAGIPLDFVDMIRHLPDNKRANKAPGQQRVEREKGDKLSHRAAESLKVKRRVKSGKKIGRPPNAEVERTAAERIRKVGIVKPATPYRLREKKPRTIKEKKEREKKEREKERKIKIISFKEYEKANKIKAEKTRITKAEKTK